MILPESLAIQTSKDPSEIRGSFHELASLAYYEGALSVDRLRAYPTHKQQIEALGAGAVKWAMIAVDNSNSGRVNTSISSLRDLEGVQIHGAIGYQVNQHELTHRATERNRTHIVSQQPALDQASKYIARNSLIAIPHEDTLGSAIDVAAGEGYFNGQPASAIGSRLAGESAGLNVGPIVNDQPYNVTTFWLVSMEANESRTGTHAAFTIEVADEPEGLLKPVRIISDAGFDMTDIDSHLTPHDDRTKSFYVEIRTDGRDANAVIDALEQSGSKPKLLGIFDDRTELTIANGKPTLPNAVRHDRWSGRQGLSIENGSQVIHVGAGNRIGSLKGMLEAMRGCNIVDMSRPLVPAENGRGFYFVLPHGMKNNETIKIIDQLGQSAYQAELLRYDHSTQSLVRNVY